MAGASRVEAMVDALVPALRDAASHRGYRLLVSSKRTPGVGDYGKFGLADADGKPILGVDSDGLTASADDIEAYLRGSELATWKKSADLAPTPPAKRKPAPPGKTDERGPPARRKRKTAASVPPTGRTAKHPEDAILRKANERKPKARSEPPALHIRKGKTDDAAAIARLLGPKRPPATSDIAERMIRLAKVGGLLVAEQGDVVGCLAWTFAPALHRPLAGRIATLIVAEKLRRTGIGRALVDAAGRALAKAGCGSIEVMSDIDIRSAHGFFRKLGFAETSARFARDIGGS